MVIDYSEITHRDRYIYMSSCAIPRPIAWIVTSGKVINIAPFSYFIPISTTPPAFIVCIGHKRDGSPKDSLRNIRESKVCTICIPTEEMAALVDMTGNEIPPQESEAERFNIDLVDIEDGYPPVIKEVKTAFFCTLMEELKVGEGITVPLILEIKKHFVDDSAIDKNGKVTFHPLARVGRSYGRVLKIQQ